MDCVEHILLCQKINIHEVWLATEGANRTDKVAQSNLNDKLNNTKYLLHFVCHYSATGPPKNPTHNEDTKLHNCKNVSLYIQCVFVFFKWQKLKRKTHERNINISSWEVYVIIIIIKHRLCKNNKYINVNNVHTIILSSGQSTLVMYAHTQNMTQWSQSTPAVLPLVHMCSSMMLHLPAALPRHCSLIHQVNDVLLLKHVRLSVKHKHMCCLL